jgi:hypothetical protein
VSYFDGELSVVTVRGKKRIGYNLKLSLEFVGINEFEGGKGKIKYSEFSDDGDRECNLKFSETEHKDAIKS